MPDIDLLIADRVAHLRLNRPHVRNAISDSMAGELAAAISRVARDPQVDVLLLTGAGPVFCAGADVDELAAHTSDRGAYVDEMATRVHESLMALRSLTIPVIAAVHGAVAGGGLGLMLACDLVVAGESCRFIPAYLRLGLTPDAGATYWLPRMIGIRRAQDLLFRRRVVGAAEALAWGLVTAVAPDPDVSAVAEGWARDLATGPRAALRETKRLLESSGTRSLAAQLHAEQSAVTAQASSDEGTEGIRAFQAHQDPNFPRPS